LGSFSKKIKELRLKNKISQKQLAQILNISPATISRYEKEKIVPTEDIIIKTALFFEVSTDYLLGLTSCPKVQSDVVKNYEVMKEKADKFDKIVFILNRAQK
jgi:transcriptional regulator with XRE-family HTH domain